MDVKELPSILNNTFNLRFDYYFEEEYLYLKLCGLDSRSLRDYIEFTYDLKAMLPTKKCVSRIKVNNQYIKISEK